MDINSTALAFGNLYIAVFVVGYVGAITPGPDILLIMRNAIAFGARAAFIALSGIICGWIVYLGCVYFGFAKVMSYPLAQGLLSVFGGIYLGYISVQIMRNPSAITLNELQDKHSHINTSNASHTSASTYKKQDAMQEPATFMHALFVNLSNPKAILFFSVVVAPFAREGFGIGLMVLFCSLVCGFVSVIVVALYVRKWLNARVFLWIDYISAVLFVLFGCALLYHGVVIFQEILSLKAY